MIKRLKKAFRKLIQGDVILCDTCKYDYGSVCTNPDRPNATDCEQYRKK